MARLVVGVALLLALAGCGGDPKADPSPSQSVTTPASTTPSPPVMPEAAKANTKAGAVAFVKYYIELINHAQATGDTQPLKDVEDPGCTSCTRARGALDKIYEAGGSISGGALSFRYGSIAPSPRFKGWLVSGTLRFAPQSVIAKAGNAAKDFSGGSAPVNAFVSRHNESHQWRVMDWTRGS
jgi:hypothetical protein